MIMGAGQSFEETTFLEYILTFPEDYASDWNFGTGFSGVFGASGAYLSLLFNLIDEELELKYFYLIISAVTVL